MTRLTPIDGEGKNCHADQFRDRGFGSVSPIEDKQTLGTAVASRILDTMNDSQDNQDLIGITDKKTFGATVMTKTITYLNNNNKCCGPGGSHNSLYDVNKNVLSYAYGDKWSGIFNSIE